MIDRIIGAIVGFIFFEIILLFNFPSWFTYTLVTLFIFAIEPIIKHVKNKIIIKYGLW